MLATMGVTEPMARERSVDWIVECFATRHRREAAEAALHTRLTFVATQAAMHGGEAGEIMDGVLSDLDDTATGDTAARTPEDDMDAVREMRQRGIGYHERINVSGAPE